MKNIRYFNFFFAVSIMLFSLYQVCSEDLLEFSEKSGRYREDKVFGIIKSVSNLDVYYCFIDKNNKEGPWIPFKENLKLSAAYGEEYEYWIKVKALLSLKKVYENTFKVYIDKKKPFPPIVNYPSGEYSEDIYLSFLNKGSDRIIYSLNNIVLEKGTVWDGTKIHLKGKDGEKTRYNVQVYTIDSVGNRSDVVSYRYDINQIGKQEILQVLDILSPVHGNFANKQILYIASTNMKWIKYTTDGMDPEIYGIYYTGPKIINKTGNITVKIAAMPRWTNSYAVRKEVVYNVEEEPENIIYMDEIIIRHYSDIRLKILSNSDFIHYYTLDDSSPTKNSKTFREKIILTGEDGKYNFYPIRIINKLPDENISGEYRFFYVIDKKQPAIYKISTDQTEPFKTAVKLFVNASKDSNIYYSIDGSYPDTMSIPYENNIIIHPKDSLPNNSILLSVVAYDHNGIKSDIMQKEIKFYLLIPEPPKIDTTSTECTNRPITFNFDNKKIIVYELTSDSSQPPEPSKRSQKIYKDFNLDAPYGIEKNYKIKFAEVDKNTYTISPSRSFNFILDKKPPNNPAVRGIPKSGYSNIPVTIYFKRDDASIYYQLTDNGSEPVLSGDSSMLYKNPIKLTAKKEGEVHYNIIAMALDDLGNISFSQKIYSCVIDRIKPNKPLEPYVIHYGDEVEQTYKIFWKQSENEKIYYTIYDKSSSKDEYLLFTNPIIIDFSIWPEGVMIKSYMEDFSGNKSDKVIFNVNPKKKRIEKPSIKGVVDGGYYNTGKSVIISSNQETIYYEISTGDIIPDYVTSSSNIYDKPIFFDSNENEEVIYSLCAKVIDNGRLDISSEEVIVRFVVDKKPPLAPILLNNDDNKYYYGMKKINFALSDDFIYYKLNENKTSDNSFNLNHFSLFTEPISIDTKSGYISNYLISAFAMDKAGNISKTVPVWELTIDKKSIFVSQFGNDNNNGTRLNPFSTIKKAVEYSRISGRKLIILGHGLYNVHKELLLPDNISIIGGYNPFSWEKDNLEDFSIIDISEMYMGGSPLFNINNKKNILIKNVKIRDSSGATPVYIQISDGQLKLQNTIINIEKRTLVDVIKIKNGKIELENTIFEANKVRNGYFINLSKGSFIAKESKFKGPLEGENFVCIKLSNGFECSAKDLYIYPGKGRITRGFLLEDTLANFSKCIIDSGIASENAVAIDVERSNISLDKVLVSCNKDSRYSIGISSSYSNLFINNSIININGKFGSTGIKVRGGDINFVKNKIRSVKTQDFLYLLDLENENGIFINNIMIGSNSSDSICAILKNSYSRWINNTFIGGTGDTNTTCFLIHDNFQSEFINNIIIRSGDSKGSAFHYIGNKKIDSYLLGNNISGWKYFLKKDFILKHDRTYNVISPQTFEEMSIGAFNLVDSEPEGGNIHSNISESITKTFGDSFAGEFHLSEFSSCINSGIDVSMYPYEGLFIDIDGDVRPAPDASGKKLFDIGADEYYEQ